MKRPSLHARNSEEDWKRSEEKREGEEERERGENGGGGRGRGEERGQREWREGRGKGTRGMFIREERRIPSLGIEMVCPSGSAKDVFVL